MLKLMNKGMIQQSNEKVIKVTIIITIIAIKSKQTKLYLHCSEVKSCIR